MTPCESSADAVKLSVIQLLSSLSTKVFPPRRVKCGLSLCLSTTPATAYSTLSLELVLCCVCGSCMSFCFVFYLFRSHCVYSEWRGLCVCLSVGHVRQLRKNGGTDRVSDWTVDLTGPKEHGIFNIITVKTTRLHTVVHDYLEIPVKHCFITCCNEQHKNEKDGVQFFGPPFMNVCWCHEWNHYHYYVCY